jgi:hypothetical protein
MEQDQISSSDEWEAVSDIDLVEFEEEFDDDIQIIDKKVITQDIVKLLKSKNAAEVAVDLTNIHMARLVENNYDIEGETNPTVVRYYENEHIGVIKPIVKVQRYTYRKEGGDDDTLKYGYGEANELLLDYIKSLQLFKEEAIHSDPCYKVKLQSLYCPYTQRKDKEVLSIGNHQDAIYSQYSKKRSYHDTRVLKDDKFQVYGLSYMFNPDKPFAKLNIYRYQEWINQLEESNKVYICRYPSFHIEEADIIDASDTELRIANDHSDIIFKRGSLSRILSNSITVQHTEQRNVLFSYKEVLEKNIHVRYCIDDTGDTEVCKPLSTKLISKMIPNLSTILTHSKDKIYNLEEINPKWIKSYRDFNNILELIKKNQSDLLKKVPKERINLEKLSLRKLKLSIFLNHELYPFRDKSIDTPVIRYLYLKDNNKVLPSLLKILSLDYSNKPPVVPQTENIKQYKKKDVISSLKGKVFESLDEAYQNLPRNPSDISFVFSPRTHQFYALNTVNFQGQLYWFISHQMTIDTAKDLKLSYSEETHCLVDVDEVNNIYHKMLHDALPTSINTSSYSQFATFMQDVYHDQRAPKEFKYVIVNKKGFDGDGEFIDPDEELNNRDFGLNYEVVDNDSDDDLDHQQIELNLDSIKEALKKNVTEKVKQFVRLFKITKIQMQDIVDIAMTLLTSINMEEVATDLNKVANSKVTEQQKETVRLKVYVKQTKKLRFQIIALLIMFVQSQLPKTILQDVIDNNSLYLSYPYDSDSSNILLIKHFIDKVKNDAKALEYLKEKEDGSTEINKYPERVRDVIAKFMESSILWQYKILDARVRMQTQKHRNDITNKQYLAKYGIWNNFKPYTSNIARNDELGKLYQQVADKVSTNTGSRWKQELLSENKSLWVYFGIVTTPIEPEIKGCALIKTKPVKTDVIKQERFIVKPKTLTIDQDVVSEQKTLANVIDHIRRHNMLFANDDILLVKNNIYESHISTLVSSFCKGFEHIEQVKILDNILNSKIDSKISIETLAHILLTFYKSDLGGMISRLANKISLSDFKYIGTKRNIEKSERDSMDFYLSRRPDLEFVRFCKQTVIDDIQPIFQLLTENSFADIDLYFNTLLDKFKLILLLMYHIIKVVGIFVYSYIHSVHDIGKYQDIKFDSLKKVHEYKNKDKKQHIDKFIELSFKLLNDRVNNYIDKTDLYEQQREQHKQGVIRQYVNMDVEKKIISKQLKRLGLLEYSPIKDEQVDDHVDDHVDEQMLDVANGQANAVHIDEREQEIAQDIANNIGENADFDDE